MNTEYMFAEGDLVMYKGGIHKIDGRTLMQTNVGATYPEPMYTIHPVLEVLEKDLKPIKKTGGRRRRTHRHKKSKRHTRRRR